MTDFLSALKTIGVVLGVWTLVSIVSAALLIPWFRARARANSAISQDGRRADWTGAARPGEAPRIARR